MLYKFVEGYTADYTAKNRCIALYTDTHCVTALHSYTATIQLHSAIHYTAIQRYTLYNLYNTPLPRLWPDLRLRRVHPKYGCPIGKMT
jgi:hypothetical protein